MAYLAKEACKPAGSELTAVAGVDFALPAIQDTVTQDCCKHLSGLSAASPAFFLVGPVPSQECQEARRCHHAAARHEAGLLILAGQVCLGEQLRPDASSIMPTFASFQPPQCRWTLVTSVQHRWGGRSICSEALAEDLVIDNTVFQNAFRSAIEPDSNIDDSSLYPMLRLVHPLCGRSGRFEAYLEALSRISTPGLLGLMFAWVQESAERPAQVTRFGLSYTIEISIDHWEMLRQAVCRQIPTSCQDTALEPDES